MTQLMTFQALYFKIGIFKTSHWTRKILRYLILSVWSLVKSISCIKSHGSLNYHDFLHNLWNVVSILFTFCDWQFEGSWVHGKKLWEQVRINKSIIKNSRAWGHQSTVKRFKFLKKTYLHIVYFLLYWFQSHRKTKTRPTGIKGNKQHASEFS